MMIVLVQYGSSRIDDESAIDKNGVFGQD